MIKVTYINHMGDDISVVNSARVSFGKKSKYECTDLVKGKWELSRKDEKLINYLAKHKTLEVFPIPGGPFKINIVTSKCLLIVSYGVYFLLKLCILNVVAFYRFQLPLRVSLDDISLTNFSSFFNYNYDPKSRGKYLYRNK